MSPPEVWGPAVWTLFHTLAEKINVNAYPAVFPSLFNTIIKISKYLPCPECASDASNFLAKVKASELKTKESLKALLCVFHNTVNAKKRKPIFHYSNIGFYGRYDLIKVVNNFISQYQTKGNMKLLTESFQRQFVINDFKIWFRKVYKAFVEPINVRALVEEPVTSVAEEPVTLEEEPVVSAYVEEEQVTLEEEPITLEEEPVVSAYVEEPVVSAYVEEPVTLEEEQVVSAYVEEPVTLEEEPVTLEEEPITLEEEQVVSAYVEEPVVSAYVEEQITLEEPPNDTSSISVNKKSKKNKNKKNKKK